jgi:hypothetical protein
MKKYVLLFAITLLCAFSVYTQENGTQVRITIGDRILTAVLYDNPSAKDFVSILPVTVTMHEFRNREKYGRLPRTLVRGGEETHAYEVGDVIYSPVRSNLAFFYAADIRGTDVPVIVIGKITSGIDAFKTERGTIEAKVELAD